VLAQAIAEMGFVAGNAAVQAGSLRRGFCLLWLAARLAPRNPRYLSALARTAAARGAHDAAARYCELALDIDADFAPAHEVLSSLFLRGESFADLMTRIHAHLKPRTYVEIGVETGASLWLARAAAAAIGIDPRPKLQFEPAPNMRVFAQTSDDFFAHRDLRSLLDGAPVDLALIDGMHHFEFALRDFMNLERHCSPRSTILLDDCFPRDRRTAERKRVLNFWSGDVWKLVVLLKKYRPDLAVHTIAVPPTGLCVIRNLDPSSTFIRDNLDRLIREFMPLDFGTLLQDRAGKLNLFPNDWERVRRLF
jgi:hypothetical protein